MLPPLTSSRTKRFALVALLCCAAMAAAARAESIIPLVQGAVWEYRISSSGTEPQPKNVTVRVAGPEELNGLELIKLETLDDDAVAKTELVQTDARGLLCHARSWKDARDIAFDPPQTLAPPRLRVGEKWTLDDSVAGNDVHEEFTVEAQEEVIVPAGTFQAFRLRCEQGWPLSLTIERWYAPGVGLVKDHTTARGASGRLISRITKVLTKFSAPSVPSVEVTAGAPPAASPNEPQLPAVADSDATPTPHAPPSASREDEP
ncbi:MAG TPA: hypothetical protein VF551_03810, partial [Chthoniobacterales bacterium]